MLNKTMLEELRKNEGIIEIKSKNYKQSICLELNSNESIMINGITFHGVKEVIFSNYTNNDSTAIKVMVMDINELLSAELYVMKSASLSVRYSSKTWFIREVE